ncbi:MAG: hypothetical protein ACR2IJ_04805, partial [Fluviibacter sp.]
MNTQDELKDWLKDQGFREYPNSLASFEDECKWIACKRYDSKYNCECNYDKPGVQVVVSPHKWHIQGQEGASVEIDITGEANGIWYKLQAYSLSWSELPEKFEQVTEALVKAW